MMARRWLILLGMLLALLAGQARADSCAITPSDIVFPSVSSISTTDVFSGSANLTVVCTWTNILGTLLTPNVSVCLYLGAGTNSSSTVTAPRQIGNGSIKANYNIYTDTSYAASKIWGGWAGTSTSSASQAITFTMTKSGGVGTMSQVIPLYGKLTADATLSANAVGADDLSATSDFGSGSALMQYSFFLSPALSCTLGPVVAIPFQVRAPIINDCNISIGNLAFPNSNLLSSTLRSTANMSVRCSKSTLYRILLSYGSNPVSTTSRRMKKLSGAEMVSYQLSNTLDGTNWGDGGNGTVTVNGSGDGNSATVTVYGRVPSQTTPSPGDYKDTITATVQF
ncbi:fimbrial major subunit CsuA/B family protein [Pseudoduganella sp. FT55W]|uniref:Fimbrial major subunit CsuA/B family protein n=1 Tax=Duganella rivi TaxID=2666083 RepID=A0A7X4KEL7_9BURK|nr:spore coat U domain-containing protein [Duganella rivi]MYM70177.1 fimbrial major subunit CsuA/B family protein [Duganella rivi]